MAQALGVYLVNESHIRWRFDTMPGTLWLKVISIGTLFTQFLCGMNFCDRSV